MRKNVGKKWEEEGGEKLVEMDEELMNREGEVFVLRRYFSRYFKVPTCSTLTYLYPL
ncbi:hypothetical protein L249_6231 [Ophiocordyceps polyrhachis-furcata BCC 54312]|uniref:Uncharacterized protein n=1 Tax=Ophiocordyceps polyrhachis-furcata BCC 54312 TaxID=1330021 RepID=A0A367L1E7_9HYPO|nr:hypothetical protein L249_6231 [Ophiocordyceps polyrhachis-furcata BCC 54312]